MLPYASRPAQGQTRALAGWIRRVNGMKCMRWIKGVGRPSLALVLLALAGLIGRVDVAVGQARL